MLLLAASLLVAFDGQYVLIDGGQFDIEDGPIPFALEPSGSADIDDGSDLQALRDAFRAWSCVRGTSVRFKEDGEGNPSVDLEDGVNSLLWDENGEFPFGPAVLGVTVGDVGTGVRKNADIVFNGNGNNTWSTDDGPSGIDVQSIALHEIGHYIGLDHPCDHDAQGNEVNCNGPERAVMTPAWSGGLEHKPRPDDEAGVKALYPDDGSSTCEGPFRKGEPCACTGECVEGLVCASIDGAESVCTETCSADESNCGDGFACVLRAPEDGDAAQGTCVKIPDDGKPGGSVCGNGPECASGQCRVSAEIKRSICQEACDADKDCEDGDTCFDGTCLKRVEVTACDEPPVGCGCAASPSTARLAPRGGAQNGGIAGRGAETIPFASLCLYTLGLWSLRRRVT